MGDILNPGYEKFKISLGSENYVDKTMLLRETNTLYNTERRFICVSRPRRFGKTMGANMLAAYYGSYVDSKKLFENFKIVNDTSFETYLNQSNVLMVNIQEFLSLSSTVEEMIGFIKTSITDEIAEAYPDLKFKAIDNFIQVMKDTYRFTGKPFVILIDEWDCLLRENKEDVDGHKDYLDFLRLWLKDQVYVGLAYMTGILPIKKYGTQSALNMFKEYSMTLPGRFQQFFGFTSFEVEQLCRENSMDFSEMKNWYNGYFVDSEQAIYNPKSVISALEDKKFSNYWSKTETFETLRDYIQFDFDDLREKITILLSGNAVRIENETFVNDMTTFYSSDDILILLVHLGYLAYYSETESVIIPNEEVKLEFVKSMKTLNWDNVISAIKDSTALLNAIWDLDCESVASNLEKVHQENTAILNYNDENALSAIISLALYAAKDYYTIIREFPAGKGFSDLVFIPRKKHLDKPALVVELKWNKTAKSAIDQIKKKNYPAALDEYQGSLLLVAVNYDKKTKKHDCIIESYNKAKDN